MKKNSFLTFLFSFIPGCGLMYLGYMKRGLQVMLLFAAPAFAAAFFVSFSIAWFAGLFLMLLPIIWFYQMFDAMHTVARMKNQGIVLPVDDELFRLESVLRFSPTQNRAVAKIIASLLIVAGSSSLILGILSGLGRIPWIDQEMLGSINRAIRYNLVPALISAILIVVGIKLLKGDKAKKPDETYDKDGDIK